MLPNQNLNIEISQLKNTIQKETAELGQKESMSRASVTEENQLIAQIKTKELELKQKEAEIQKLRIEIQQSNNNPSVARKNSSALSSEIGTLKRDKISNEQKLKKLEMKLVEVQGLLQNINTEISQLKNTIQKETNDLLQKENTSRASIAEGNSLSISIKKNENEIKQKEVEVQRFKNEIQQFNNKLSIAKKNFGLLSTGIGALKRSKMANEQQLRKLEVEAQDALRRVTDVKGIKGIKPRSML